jgi:hypothetical protein
VADVVAARRTRIVLLTDRHIAYLYAKHHHHSSGSSAVGGREGGREGGGL